jgi:hypothetical protein
MPNNQPGVVDLILRISLPRKGKTVVTEYRVRFYRPDEGAARAPTLRLFRCDSTEIYDVAFTEHGPTCTCGSATFRGNGTCKHTRAVLASGLASWLGIGVSQ